MSEVEFENPTDADIEVPRALATLGLLRKVSDRVPMDLLYMYCQQTAGSRTSGIKYLLDELTKKECVESNIPSGLITMARDYLIRMFWTQMSHIRRIADYTYNDGRLPTRDSECGSYRLYPKSVLDVLKSINISDNFSLYDARNAVHDLHEACLACSKTVRLNENGKFDMPDRKFTIERVHERVINSLRLLESRHRWNSTTRLFIPNDIEKEVLINIYEIFLMMFSELPFGAVVAFNDAYTRATKVTGEVTAAQSPRVIGREDMWRLSKFGSPEARWDRTANVCDKLRNLTPEAAICLDFSTVSDSYSIRYNYLYTNVKEPVVPQVGIYLQTEFTAWKRKYRYAEEIRKKLAGKGYRCGSYDGECCAEEPAPAPCCCC